jgi:amino acid transporter
LPIATYAYIGVEIVAVTAVEAKTPKISLRRPARNIAWITGLFYFACVIAFYFNVSFKDPHLPGYHLRDGIAIGSNSSTALILIAADNAGVEGLSSVLTVFLIIAVLSAANTALYVASRTLWGVACDFDAQLINSPNIFKRWFSRLSTTTPSKVPGWALFVSCFFIWIPIWQGTDKDAVANQNVR